EMETGISGSGSPPKLGFSDVSTRSSRDSYRSMATPIVGGQGQLHMGSFEGDATPQLNGLLDKREKGDTLGRGK
ncbi:unnamed protein product, partial [Ilex paraguariensis]